MRAEHRKELQTNLLADQMGKLFHRGKSSSKVIWVLLMLIVVLVFAFWLWTDRTSAALTAAWTGTWNLRNNADDAEIAAEKYRGTAAERAAKLAQADHLFQQGKEAFFRSPASARDKFEQAAKVYHALGGNHGNSKDLAVRPLLGEANCREWLGEIDEAKRLNKQVVDRYHDHPLAGEARKKLDELDKTTASAFYKEWPGRLPTITSTEPKNPLTPPEPPAEKK